MVERGVTEADGKLVTSLPLVTGSVLISGLVVAGDLAVTAASVTGSRLNIKTIFPRYEDSHVKDKTVVRPSHLKHGDPYTGKTTSLY